ncbi:LysR family transcriptional regulator [Pseudoduganella albidiflava]|uniref:LysR family transcriptional regulator n=1 Tax=Pseudoduganella albidiflava TaxID=321983 RepID=A0A411X0B2_9BURK|nr:LysR family transcriptional regulator [Pseudoduganella albidiflava]QBI02389.1 LysR family transcriptional regulator [Pseudoduganella albidiflava]GGY43203.1 LysR family transcriptional regulator [Pseudoduganella albidiflava]
MELRHLRYFVAVADEKNITRAAERLNIAQPPLSRQIQQLEEELGVVLIEKGSRPLRLTEAGRFFHAHAQELLDKAQDLKAMTRRVGKIERKLSIGFVASTLYGLLPEIVRRFRDRYQTVEISFHELTTIDQLKALKEGTIDVGFGRLKGEDAAIRRIVLREEPLIVALPVGHRLTQQPGPLRMSELMDDPLIVYPKTPRPSFADQVLATFRERMLVPRQVIEVRELQIAIGLVGAGQGIAIVPDSLQGMIRTDVVYRPIDDRQAVSPIIFSARAMDRSQELADMLAIIYEIYEERHIAYVPEAL